MKTYDAYLSSRTRDQLLQAKNHQSVRYEYRDGKIVTLDIQYGVSYFKTASMVEVINVVACRHEDGVSYRSTSRCCVCGERMNCEKRVFALPDYNLPVCEQCLQYVDDCINNVSDRAIICRYYNWRPFVVIRGSPKIIVVFREECAIRWCDVAGQSNDLRIYRSSLIHHTWLYTQSMLILVNDIRYVIINLALHDNDLGVDQTI